MENNIKIKDLAAWFLCVLFFMYEFLLRTVMGTLQPSIMADFQLNTVEFAVLSTTSYQCIYGVMQILVGILIAHFGVKRSLLSAIILCSITSFGFALTHQFNYAIVFRLLMGLGSSFGFICLLITIYDRMPRKYVAVWIGLSQFLGTLGPMLAAGPLSTITEANTYNWRDIFYILAIFAAVLAVLVQIFVDKNRPASKEVIYLSRPSTISEKVLQIVRHKQIWLIAIFSGSTYFALEYLSENEGVSFLMMKGMSPTFSSYMISLAWLGYALGCPILGLLSDKLQRRKPFIILTALTTCLALIGIVYVSSHDIFTGFCFFLLGFGASGSSIGFAIAAEQSKEDNLALILGFNNMAMVFFTLISTLTLSSGLSFIATSHHALEVIHYQKAFILAILFALPAIIASFYVRETFCKSRSMHTKLIIDRKVNATMELNEPI